MERQKLKFVKEFVATNDPERLKELKDKEADYKWRYEDEKREHGAAFNEKLIDVAYKLVILREILEKEDESDALQRVVRYDETKRRVHETLHVEDISETFFMAAWVVIYAYNEYGVAESRSRFERDKQNEEVDDDVLPP